MGDVNYWKIATFILLGIAIFLVFFQVVVVDGEITLDDVKIKERDIDSYQSVIPEGGIMRVCEVGEDKCTLLFNINEE